MKRTSRFPNASHFIYSSGIISPVIHAPFFYSRMIATGYIGSESCSLVRTVADQVESKGLMFLWKPIVAVEVLTSGTDAFRSHRDVFEHKSRSDSRYMLLLDQEEGRILFHQRSQEGWTGRIYDRLDDVVDLPDTGDSLRLKDIYEELCPR